MLFPLSKLDIGQIGEVRWLSDHRAVTPRLLDLGFEPGTRVTCMLKKCGGELSAFLVKGAVIAIRREDAEAVLVSDTWDDGKAADSGGGPTGDFETNDCRRPGRENRASGLPPDAPKQNAGHPAAAQKETVL